MTARQGPWRLVAHTVRPYRVGLALALSLLGLAVLVDLLKPWPTKVLVDNVLRGDDLPAAAGWLEALPGAGSPGGQAAWLAGLTVALFLSGAGLLVLHRYLLVGLTTRMTFDLGARVFEHLQRQSLAHHGQQSTGDLVRRVTTDAACVRDAVAGLIAPMATAVLSIGAMFVVMWTLDPLLALVALGVCLPLWPAVRRTAPAVADRGVAAFEADAELMALAEQVLTALPSVQAFGQQEALDARYRAAAQVRQRAAVRSARVEMRMFGSTAALAAVGTALVAITGGIQVVRGDLSLGTLLVFLAYLSALYAPVETVAHSAAAYATFSAGARRILGVLDEDHAVPDPAGARVLTRRALGAVSFQDVTFGWDPARPVLRDVWLDVLPGETVAVVGGSGAGKSTLLALVPRLVDPDQGRVTLDGVDVRDLDLASLREQVSVVLQEPFLLPISIAENIAYGRADATQGEVVEAARAAGAAEFVESLPDGYDTVLGERGASLSGGQRQRIAIARALLRDAPVLILDEPTSAVDVETEATLLEALQALRRGRTTFVIAHRMSTIRDADRVVVVQDGRLTEGGAPSDLLART